MKDKIEKLLHDNKFEQAAALSTQWVDSSPDMPSAWLMLSQTARALQRLELAVKAAIKALSLDKNNPEILLHLATAYLEAGDFQQAVKAALQAQLQASDDFFVNDAIGRILYQSDRFNEALVSYQQAVGLKPEHSMAYQNLAATFNAIGDFDHAKKAYIQALSITDSDSLRAYYPLCQLSKATVDDNFLQPLSHCILQSSESAKPFLYYARAKQYEDLNRYKDSFADLLCGAAAKRSTLSYSTASSIALFTAIKEAYNKAEVSPVSSVVSTPIFICGLPRSGTTLVEQIIAAHSHVLPGGELHYWPSAISGALQRKLGCRFQTKQPNADYMNLTQQLDWGSIALDYLELVRVKLGQPNYFTDKLPINYLFAGFIAKAMPQAKIINLRRHPMDSCFSQFKLLFDSGYSYSYDLRELAEYYLCYLDLMQFWQSELGDRLLTVDYETVVANVEGESKRIISFCGLEWDEQCLAFYNNKNGVTTASFAQVRQPIYNSSVQKWKHYEKQLAPLQQRLEQAGIKV